MNERYIKYFENETELEGFAVVDNFDKKSLVILCHAWRGRDDFICEKARLLAEQGYFCFAVDMYGKGVLGKNNTENAALKKPFIDDRAFLQRRILKGYQIAKEVSQTTDRIAVLGYGFGGICALDLARSGVDVSSVITVYGHFDEPKNAVITPIKSKVLILHGYNDPIANQQEVKTFTDKLTEQKTDWQVHLYSDTYHAFANPMANDPSSGILYNQISAARSWTQIQHFLQET